MILFRSPTWPLRVLAACAALGLAPLASAEAPEETTYRASIYLWGAGIQGETPRGGDVDVGFDTLVRNLDLAFMGAFEARKGPWSLIGNLIYLNVGIEDGATLPLVGPSGRSANLRADARVSTKGWVLGLAGGYQLAASERGNVDVLLGVRYLDLTLDLDLDLDLVYGPSLVAAQVSGSQQTWDIVAGLRGRVELGQGWFLPWWIDVGTGESDLTWQAAGGVGYGLGRTEVSLLYRHLAWDFGPDDQLDNISFSGPMLAATWRF